MATAYLLGQARAFLNHPHLSAQAQARIKKNVRLAGQARAVITARSIKGQAQAVIRTPLIYLQDTFTRFAGNTWGQPDIGNYTTYFAEPAFNVDGSYGTITSNEDFTPTVISPVNAFNQNILMKYRHINVDDMRIQLVFRHSVSLTEELRDMVTLELTGSGQPINIQVEDTKQDIPPYIVLDNNIVWQVQQIDFYEWPADTELFPEELNTISIFTGNRYWKLTTVGTTGLVEPNWSDPQPIIDGTAQWTEVLPDAWTAATGFTAGDYLVPSVFNFNIYLALNTGTSDSTEPNPWPFYGNFNDYTVVDGTVLWQYGFPQFTTWDALAEYTEGAPGFFTGLYMWIVTTTGTSDVSEPDWSVAGPITDGTVEWTKVPAWTALTAYAEPDLVVPTVENGYYYQIITGGTSAATEPSPWPELVEHFFINEDEFETALVMDNQDTQVLYVLIVAQDDTYNVTVWDDDTGQPGTFDVELTSLYTTEPGDFELTLDSIHAVDEGSAFYLAVDEINITDPTALAGRMVAQAAALIRNPNTKLSAQAQARIVKAQLYGQAQASINGVKKVTGQARALINNPTTPTVPVIITGGGSINAGVISQSDISDLGLPGYLQEEALISDMQIEQFDSPFSDSSRSEYTGLSNKELTIKMRIWDTDWATCKNRLELAATQLRARRDGPLNLFLYEQDKYYQVWVKEIRYDKGVPESPRILDYTVTFEARPWLESITENTITTIGDVSTVGRTYDDGGWTPISLIVSGTNVSIVGTTDDGTAAGEITIPGTVTNLEINTETGVAILNYVIRNDLLNADFGLYVGPGVTNYVITGASNVIMTYRNRWYL